MIPSERLDYIACRTQPHPGVLRSRPRRPRVMAIFHRVPDLPEGGDEAELSLPPRGRKRQLDGGRAPPSTQEATTERIPITAAPSFHNSHVKGEEVLLSPGMLRCVPLQAFYGWRPQGPSNRLAEPLGHPY